jgi:hypothetical protein
MSSLLRVKLGGEGEVPGVLNQQPPFALLPSWFSWRHGGKTLNEVQALGHQFIIADNTNLPFADGSVDEVFTNNVPLDTNVRGYGPGVQSSEIRRILKSGGRWVHNGQVKHVQP